MLGEAVAVGERVAVGVALGVGDTLGVAVGVNVPVPVGVTDAVGLSVGVAVLVKVPVGVRVGVGVRNNPPQLFAHVFPAPPTHVPPPPPQVVLQKSWHCAFPVGLSKHALQLVQAQQPAPNTAVGRPTVAARTANSAHSSSGVRSSRNANQSPHGRVDVCDCPRKWARTHLHQANGKALLEKVILSAPQLEFDFEFIKDDSIFCNTNFLTYAFVADSGITQSRAQPPFLAMASTHLADAPAVTEAFPSVATGVPPFSACVSL